MKKLEKVRLINWHRFVNETVELDDSVLLSGENATGKSTILDAIQFVMTCSKAHFNEAANEQGKRTLNGYVRCKTGKENHPYERSGEITGHVALQFYEESKDQTFVVGVVMDSSSEEKEPNVIWYLMEKQELCDELFLLGDRVKSIAEFRATNPNIRTLANTQTEAKRMMLSRFGRLEDKFFSLIPKALVFKPIHNIKDFVYSYVLDEKKVNIEVLKENVRSYQDLDRILQDVKTRIRELGRINDQEAVVENCLQIDRRQVYYLARAEVELTRQEQEEALEKERFAQLRQQELRQEKRNIQKTMEERQETVTSLSVELSRDENYQTMHEMERRKAELEELILQDQQETEELRRAVSGALTDAEKLLRIRDTDPCVREYKGILENLEKCGGLASALLCLEKVISWKKKTYEKVQERLAENRVLLHSKEESMTELRGRIGQLEKKRLTYPPEVTALAQKIREELQQCGRSGEVRTLCELLEITSPEWQDAVEGYLNNQRFYLLVEPDDFDLALSVYDQMREKKKAYGAGLIHTGKLEPYDECPAGSLAEVVSSKSVWARKYINMVLGRVHRCQSSQELKQYPVAITKQCMRYQNHVVSAIPPAVYRTPYIGAEAYLRQLEQCRDQEKTMASELESLNQKIRDLVSVSEPLDSAHDVDVKYRIGALEALRTHQNQHEQCVRHLEELEKDETILHKTARLTELQKELRALQEDMSQADHDLGRYQQEETQQAENFRKLEEQMAGQNTDLSAAEQQLGPEFSACSREYEKLRETRALEKLRESFERTRRGNQADREKAEAEMGQLMNAYKAAHDFGAAGTLEGYPEFRKEYDRLKDSQLLSYEEKVQAARRTAEEEFREQFLSRLQENIKQAQNEFRELNQSLRNIHFNHEQYEFLYEPSRQLKKYYQMIMDDFNVMRGESLFSGVFQENHREVIEELFERLALEDENSTKVLEEYTDYRTYMDYDIKIQHDDGSYMLYSKVSREKSGGETQTPFYITVAASFMQLYRNSIGGDAIGLVMFDEAFNNMDEMRMDGVLEFLTHSNLQVIIAAPTEKIQYIAPAMKKILLILQDDSDSYVEDFTRTLHG